MVVPFELLPAYYLMGNAGRAGLLGMAISLVSTVPERVWYVKAKGYKPWLNPKPQDTNDNDDGGHTIWYNEPNLLQVTGSYAQPMSLWWPQLSISGCVSCTRCTTSFFSLFIVSCSFGFFTAAATRSWASKLIWPYPHQVAHGMPQSPDTTVLLYQYT